MLPLGRALAFLIFFIFYLLLGGYLFNSIECPEEMASKNIPHTLYSHMEYMDYVDPVPPLDSICELCHTLNYPGMPKHMEGAADDCKLWSFYNSVFFAFTSITTIGYGRTAPQTQLGRGALLIYSFFGIPINGILIGTIAAFFKIKVRVCTVASFTAVCSGALWLWLMYSVV